MDENADFLKSNKHVNSSVEDRILTMSYILPFNIRQSKWQKFIWKQFVEHQIASIREEIIDVAAASMLEKYYFERSFKFVKKCLSVAWLQLFDWISLRLERSKCDTFQRIDVEPQSSQIDSWIFRNALQNLK
ncbi:uncharacterized protein LOC114879468 [Osmia bicornis bicornis]|uniref:uncharacterized protein LOC114879468 n=1 Tax=Osmia bicornis bicornis TaxID=1437191 RepID=UPI0010F8D437|nr:uncharacterized protein LOC114879468 [Osmia bicornis bicornis]